MAVDTAAKRKSVVDYALPGPALPMGDTAGVVVGERAHLTALYSGFSYTITVSAKVLVVNAVDEASTGGTTIYAQFKNQDGASLAFDAAPTIRIWSVNPSTGADVVDVAETAMSQVGGSNTYEYDWTPAANGVYSVLVEGFYSTERELESCSVTIRSKVDPVAFALDELVVTRF